jgi:hypothetical protein
METLALILIPAVLFVGVVAGLLELRRRNEEEPGRHWWSNPFSWIGVAVFLVLGLFVFPRLLGITFVFLPLVWIGGLRRRRRED